MPSASLLAARLSLLVAALLLLALVSPPSVPLVAGAPFELTIGYSIDTLGRMLPVDKSSVECKPADLAASASKRAGCFGGVARRYTFAQKLRANYSNVLMLNVGDEWFGTSFQAVSQPAASSIGRWVAWGAGTPDRFYDVATVGPADFFAPGPPTLRNYLSAMGGNLPIVMSNMDWSADPNLQAFDLLPFWVTSDSVALNGTNRLTRMSTHSCAPNERVDSRLQCCYCPKPSSTSRALLTSSRRSLILWSRMCSFCFQRQ